MLLLRASRRSIIAPPEFHRRLADDAMSDELPLTELFQRHCQGDADAARLLFERYSRRLCRLAERHLSHKLAGCVDGDDAKPYQERDVRELLRIVEKPS